MDLFALYRQAYDFYKENSRFQFSSILQKFLKYEFDAQQRKFVRKRKLQNSRKRMLESKEQSKVKKIRIDDDDVIVLSSEESVADSDSESIESISKIGCDVEARLRQFLPHLMSMFPDASPLYIKTLLVYDICEKNLYDDMLINSTINYLLQNPYPTVTDPLNMPNAGDRPTPQDESDEGIDITDNDIDPDRNQELSLINSWIGEMLKKEYPDKTPVVPEDITKTSQEENRSTTSINDNKSLTLVSGELPQISDPERATSTMMPNLPSTTNNINASSATNASSADDGWTITNVTSVPSSSNLVIKEEPKESDKKSDTTGEGKIDSNTDAIVLKLLPIFPDVCPQYLRKICAGKENTPATLEEIITFLIQNDFPKRKKEQPKAEPELDEEEQYQIMCSVLPDADPTFLRYNCSLLINHPEKLRQFVNTCIENKEYPTMQEYKRKQQISAQVKDYTTEFNVSKFLDVIPNPEGYFSDPRRTYTYNKDIRKKTHTKDILKNLFTHLKMLEITRAIQMHDGKVLKTYHYLETLPHSLKKCRKKGEWPQLYGEPDIPYLQEIAYIIHLKEINEEIKKRTELKRLEFERAKELGLLLECNCCFDNELLEVDVSRCLEGHIFCNNCIVKSVEIAFSENKTVFPCLTQCTSEFSLTCLQKILKPKLFSKLALKKQLEEVKAAGIEDLESCPFCDFATIVPPNDRIFKCLNDECMKESCRLCKEPSHIPLRCEEVEKPQEVKARTYIEDKMTEALLRKCWKCGLKFIKEDGCNKMRCSCGALMCYVCGKPVQDYSHFNGQGGTNYHLCPLYSDTEKLHVDAVRKVAEEAKKEIKQQNPQVELKHDPTVGLPKAPKKDRVYRPGPELHNIPHNVQIRINNNNVPVRVQQIEDNFRALEHQYHQHHQPHQPHHQNPHRRHHRVHINDDEEEEEEVEDNMLDMEVLNILDDLVNIGHMMRFLTRDN